jgi:2-polyprenyl-3-methyl-5-hydroxy-6-metoxy-1,4-benzoquinol methylase
MQKTTKQIKNDFDQLAEYETDDWNHNRHYHRYLLDLLPVHCQEGLEIGCGTGSFSRQLADRVTQVTALDLSPQMIRFAKQRSIGYSNITYQVADVLAWDIKPEQYDCIVSIATMHHLPFETSLQRMKIGLRPNGKLMILDLYQSEGFGDLLINLAAIPVHYLLKLKHTGTFQDPKEIRRAWQAHGRLDTYLSLSQIRAISTKILPAANLHQHLLWRYSLIWEKPG